MIVDEHEYISKMFSNTAMAAVILQNYSWTQIAVDSDLFHSVVLNYT